MNGERKLALFIHFENIARGVKEAQYKQFEVELVLKRLLEKGKIIVRRAYADWNRFTEYKRPFHEWAIELIDVPRAGTAARTPPTSGWWWTRSTWPTARPTSTASRWSRATPTSRRWSPSCARTTAMSSGWASSPRPPISWSATAMSSSSTRT